jgi:coenzyme F420-0:L-glutamate ligase / coenzyme F420-1:gamma-L-glutamate ligase
MGTMTLTIQPLSGVPLVQPGDNLPQIIRDAVERAHIQLAEGDILVLAQKIVSKAEGRLVNLSEVTPTPEAEQLAMLSHKDARFVELVLRESRAVLRTRPGTIIVQHRCGFVCANAGIDHSNVSGEWGNAEDWVLLLPEDADRSAREIQHKLEQSTGVRLAVLIIDSHGRAWRMGTVGMAIGFAGLPGVVDLRGEKDLFGYQLRITQVAAADELAAAASLMMGEAGEGIPLVHVRGFPYPLRAGSMSEIIRPKDQDLFR